MVPSMCIMCGWIMADKDGGNRGSELMLLVSGTVCEFDVGTRTSGCSPCASKLSLLATVDENETSIMVVSDHGSKRMDGCICLNDWLYQNGYLALKEPLAGKTRFDEKNVDWSKTKAWSWGGYYARVFMNVKGREPEGIIDPADFERERDELGRKLEAIPDDLGQPMKTRALTPKSLYNVDKVVGIPPDLFVYFGDLLWRVTQDMGNDGIYSFETEIGPDDSVHDYDGICIIKSPQHTGGKRLNGLGVIDGAPTMLTLLGVPVPDDMEGHVVGALGLEQHAAK